MSSHIHYTALEDGNDRYRLCAWAEGSATGDYDNYMGLWNATLNRFEQILTGTTRGMVVADFSSIKEPTAALVATLAPMLVTWLFKRAVAGRERNEPRASELHNGRRVVLNKKTKCRDKSAPKTGGNHPWAHFAKGETGEVFWSGKGNGTPAWNDLGRDNGRVGIHMDDGRTLYTAMKNVGVERPYIDDAGLMAGAEHVAQDLNFKVMFTSYPARLDHNWAADAAA